MKRNIVPIIGFIAGVGLIVWAISTGGSVGGFVDVPSLIITLAGSFCALLISFPLETLKGLPKVMKKLLISPDNSQGELINTFTDLSKKARSQGILSIEEDIQQLENELLVQGLQMAVDGMEPEAIREILEVKVDNIEKRHSVGQDIFNKWAELAPAFGMVGTLIGLINMLSKLSDPSSIGSGMAVALLTTLYGAFLANLVFIPIATNLKFQTEKEMQTCEMIIEGVLSLQAGQNPRILEQKLRSYLPEGASTDEAADEAVLPRQPEDQQYG